MQVPNKDDEYGVPDDESPEITEEDMVWAVRARDFPSFRASHDFLIDRTAFLLAAEAAGIPKEAFLNLSPNKPGFIERATAAVEQIARAGRHAAE